ncbi:MAG: ECF-type sigma factor [Pseudomonadota bacterium]
MSDTPESDAAASSSEDITLALARWQDGQSGADHRLMALVYPVLHRIAAARLAGEHRATLQTTELVHEAYLKLVDQQGTEWKNRNHFFAVASLVVRRILVDHARRRASGKRGGGVLAVTFDEELCATGQAPIDWLGLDDCLDDLARIDAAAARVVELRFFAGMSIDDSAEALGLGRTTVVRKWRFAKVFLEENWQRD